MKKFILKTSVFIILLLVSSLTLFTYKSKYQISIINQQSIDSSNIVIFGDSRADRQINPSILHFYTNLNCINLAESSLDLYSLSKRLINLNFRNKTIIISASFWQINDGSISDGYFRPEAFNDLTIIEKVRLYRYNFEELLRIQSNIITHSSIMTIGYNNRFVNNGYGNIECKEFVVQDSMFSNHAWYRKINTDGIKRKLLYKALINLNKISCNKIIIYNAPVSSIFKRMAQKNGVWLKEEEYNSIILSFIKKSGLKNLDFYNLMDLDGFNDNDYYDAQHLCETGSNKFSKKIVTVFDLLLSSSIKYQTPQGSN
jgi:hypothetical protein